MGGGGSEREREVGHDSSLSLHNKLIMLPGNHNCNYNNEIVVSKRHFDSMAFDSACESAG